MICLLSFLIWSLSISCFSCNLILRDKCSFARNCIACPVACCIPWYNETCSSVFLVPVNWWLNLELWLDLDSKILVHLLYRWYCGLSIQRHIMSDCIAIYFLMLLENGNLKISVSNCHCCIKMQLTLLKSCWTPLLIHIIYLPGFCLFSMYIII